MRTTDLHDELEALYQALLDSSPGSVARAGQREMLHAIGAQLAQARFEPDQPARVCVVEAGTGVGKTRAYLAAAITLARRAGVKVVVSTSTIALQEQVMGKDLPELAKAMEVPPVVALLKGRGRYLCPVKLDLACNGEQTPMALEEPSAAAPQQAPLERFEALKKRWGSGAWNGERDSLGPDDLALWGYLAADRHACTGRHCPQFHDCPYFDAKRAAAKADVLVANHDLVLASLRSDLSSLPSGERAIYIFDEGHHLPATALSHFACEASLSERRWLQRLDKALDQAARSLSYPLNLEGCTSLLIQALDDLLRGVMQSLGNEAIGQLHEAAEDRTPGSGGSGPSTRIRFERGELPPELLPLWQAVGEQAHRLHAKATEFSAWLKQERAEDEELAPLIAQHVSEIGAPFKRLNDLLETAELMLDLGEPPAAKWLDFGVGGGSLRVVARACPLFASGVLRRHLWPLLRGAVITSATLRALGRFDYFLKDSGLAGLPNVQALEVASPFDYATQGEFTVVQTKASPKQASEHTAEVAKLLAQDLKAVAHGALVLCSSWVQLHAIVAALPASLRRQLHVQGESAREQLLREHRAAVERGERSILVGLQSFGEGLDLPGQQCEWVFMPKLPFLTPDDPVQEARAEWLEAKGRSSFNELVVPATGVRLNQWAGRGIRSEQDHAHIVCYDGRLASTPFGRQLLAGLPGFTKKLRRDGVETAL